MLSIAQALLAVCVCLGCVPVIRFRKGGPGEMIGRHLNTLLREQLSGQNVWVTNAFRNGMFQRPVSGLRVPPPPPPPAASLPRVLLG